MARDIGQMYAYNDERFTAASNDAIPAIEAMVQAGGSSADVENAIKDALDNAGVQEPAVAIGGKWRYE